MNKSTFAKVRTLIKSLHDEGHNKQDTVQSLIDVFGVTEEMASDLFNACMGESSGIYCDHELPVADCDNCKFNYLPHSGGYCYMFAESPGEHCGQFERKK